MSSVAEEISIFVISSEKEWIRTWNPTINTMGVKKARRNNVFVTAKNRPPSGESKKAMLPVTNRFKVSKNLFSFSGGRNDMWRAVCPRPVCFGRAFLETPLGTVDGGGRLSVKNQDGRSHRRWRPRPEIVWKADMFFLHGYVRSKGSAALRKRRIFQSVGMAEKSLRCYNHQCGKTQRSRRNSHHCHHPDHMKSETIKQCLYGKHLAKKWPVEANQSKVSVSKSENMKAI